MLHATKNDLKDTLRRDVIVLLNQHLANAIDLQTQCKQAHWNVKGPQFIALHKLFDEINESVEEYIDELAERLVQLGGVALGTARIAAKESDLPEYPKTAVSGEEHAQALSTVLSVFGKHVRAAIDWSAKKGDANTADLFTEISRGTDKWLWFVEAHLQGSKR